MHHVTLQDLPDAQPSPPGFPCHEGRSETTRRFRDLKGAVVQFDGARVRTLSGAREFRGRGGLAIRVTVVEPSHAVRCAQSQSGWTRQAGLVAVAEADNDTQGDQHEHNERQNDQGVHDPGIPLRPFYTSDTRPADVLGALDVMLS